MITALINISGNVGKSTLTHALVEPRLDDPDIVRIEKLNSGGSADVQAIGAHQFKELARQINFTTEEDNLIIDMGASEMKDILAKLRTMEGTEQYVDLWILPTVANGKQLEDTARTATILISLGVKPERIVVVPNMVEDVDTLETDFWLVSQHAKKHHYRFCEVPILQSEAYGAADQLRRSIADLAADNEGDYRDVIRRSEKYSQEAIVASDTMYAMGMAKSASKNLTAVWNCIMRHG